MKLLTKHSKTKEKKAYNEIFRERFNIESDVSIESNEADFFIKFIEKIKKEYKKQIEEIKNEKDEVEANEYINNEKIRLDILIKELESTELGTKYIGGLFSVALPIVIFGLSNILSLNRDSISVVVDNKLNQLSIEDVALDKISHIFSQYLSDLSSLVANITAYILMILAGGLICLEVSYYINKNRINRKTSFNKFCIEALRSVEKEINGYANNPI